MVSDAIQALQERSNAKLRYADLHLGELLGHGPPDGSDFDLAHTESFLYHLFGTRDSLIAELNVYYGANLPSDELSPGKLRTALNRKGVHSAELADLYALESDKDSWYSIAKEFRDHSTHVGTISRAYYLGGKDHHKVKFRKPHSDELVEAHFHDAFSEWLQLMKELIAAWRSSAMETCGIA